MLAFFIVSSSLMLFCCRSDSVLICRIYHGLVMLIQIHFSHAVIVCVIKKRSMLLLVSVILECFALAHKFFVLDDYRLTAAISLLKILINRLTSDNTFVTSRCSSPRSSTPVRPRSRHQPSRQSTPIPARRKIIPEVAFNLAIQACEYFVGSEEHNDIDSETSLVRLYT